MRTTLRCRKCGASLTVEGPGRKAKVIARPVTCPRCQEINETQWPSKGHYLVTVKADQTPEP